MKTFRYDMGISKITAFRVIGHSDHLGCQFTLFAHSTSEVDNRIAIRESG